MKTLELFNSPLLKDKKKQSLKLKKKQLTVVCHTVQWFINRIGKYVFYRTKIEDNYLRNYIKIDTEHQARSLYVHQNITGKRYFL